MSKTGKCDGCGREGEVGYKEDLAEIHASPHLKVTVCNAKRGDYLYLDGGYRVRHACFGTALAKSKCCPGCGKAFDHSGQAPGELCASCWKTLDAVRSHASAERKAYGLSRDLIPGDVMGWSEADELIKLLASAISGKRAKRIRFGDASRVLPRTGPLDPPEAFQGPWSGDTYLEAVELAEDQVEAVESLFVKVAEAINKAYQKGLEEGGSPFVQLAQGKLSIDAFDATTAKQRERVKQELGDEE